MARFWRHRGADHQAWQETSGKIRFFQPVSAGPFGFGAGTYRSLVRLQYQTHVWLLLMMLAKEGVRVSVPQAPVLANRSRGSARPAGAGPYRRNPFHHGA